MSLKTDAIELAIKQALKMLHRDPEKGLELLLKASNKLAPGEMSSQRKFITEAFEDKDSNWHRYILHLIQDIDPDVLDAIAINFFVNTSLIGWNRQQELRKTEGHNIPFAILLDPTSACNLHCTGCWAADYGNKLNLSYEDIDSIIEQGKELGVYWYIYTGGEPLVRKRDIIRLCEKHSDCIFLSFTNATLIDEDFCKDVLRVRNFIPAISEEGTRETTDARRGEGTYDRIMNAMRLMREYRLPFGISCCYTSANVDVVGSDDYVKKLEEWGALFCWYFHYMPVGSDADISLLPNPEQREFMYEAIRRFRCERQIFCMDFQNDGEFVQGCVAGGRRYLHINANGDVDPCVFVHFSDSNIHEKTLVECLKSPLFMAYYNGQPFNDNMLRPCPMLENPEKLRQMIEETGAHSSNMEGVETADSLCSRCDQYAERWKPHADQLWHDHPHIVPFCR